AHSQDGLFTLDKNIAAEGSEVTLTNTSGKEVFRSKLTSHTFNTQQPQGVYIMKLQTKEGKTYSKKVIIK
uniref:T9SS type A sorting domain-containing protein n=1 Tax=uncultured Chryseobacterium sp. TaxID=259322 RepID=UPI0025859330